MDLLNRLFRTIGSFGFAVVLLLFLLLLTWLGTLEQVEFGLYDVQKKYFDSLFLVHEVGPLAFRFPWADSPEPLFRLPALPLPLPGVYLLLALLLLNLLVGGIVRLKKDWRRAGILVTHLGIVLMLAAGFVKFRWSIEGNLPLSPPEVAGKGNLSYPELNQSDEFHSYHEWEVAVFEAVPSGPVREHVIRDEEWLDLAPGSERRFESDELPFDVTVTRQFRNCRVFPKGPMFTGDGPVIDGYVVRREATDKEAERNIAGLYLTFTEKGGGRRTEAILWGVQQHPFTLEAGGRRWLVDLRKRRFKLPFTIRLDKFTFEQHPGTTQPNLFLSDVTKIEGDREQAIKISMNEPLRYQGYTLFQASYGPSIVSADWEAKTHRTSTVIPMADATRPVRNNSRKSLLTASARCAK